ARSPAPLYIDTLSLHDALPIYYSHALRRFDKSKSERAKHNLLILWADEAQRFMTASEDGTSDYNCVDVIREAGATIVAATQSTRSEEHTSELQSPDHLVCRLLL